MNRQTIQTKEKISIILLSIAILVAIAVIGIIAIYNSKDARLKRQLSLGDKYLDGLEYEDALLEYQIALAIDPKAVDAYVGAATAYIGMDAYDLADEMLEQGIQNVGAIDEFLKMREQVHEQLAFLEAKSHAEDLGAQKEEKSESSSQSAEEVEQDEEELEKDEPSKEEQFSDDYRELYAAFLRANKNSERGLTNRFELIYIDEDYIPEVAMTDGADHPTGVNIYKFIEGELVEIGTLGAFGSMEYIDHGNKLHTATVYSGDFFDVFSSIENNELVTTTNMDYVGPDNVFGIDEVYRLDDKEVSKQMYNSTKEELMSGNYVGCLYEEMEDMEGEVTGKQTMHDINDANIEQYVMNF